jgi:hypothetical protein
MDLSGACCSTLAVADVAWLSINFEDFLAAAAAAPIFVFFLVLVRSLLLLGLFLVGVGLFLMVLLCFRSMPYFFPIVVVVDCGG